MTTRNNAIYLVVMDYLAQMAEAKLISQQELAIAQRLAAIRYGQERVWESCWIF